jgi:regulator of protease activity HflC (stomatin/prohibitin superfamily)
MAAQNFKYLVFFTLVFLILASLYTVFIYQDFLVTNFVWIALLVFFAWVVYKYDFVLQLLDYQRAVIFRFGKVNRVGGPGWAIVWPIIETSASVDLRVKTVDVPKQHVVTKDGVEVTIDAVVYLKVKKDNQSVVNSIIEVENHEKAAQLFVVSSLRDVIGSMMLSDVIANIEVINAQIKENLEQISKSWGIAVDSIEIKDVEIPEAVLNAMHEQKAAVQQKLARMERALAQKAEIDAVREAAASLDDKALAYYYIKAIEGMANSKGSKVFFPSEFSKLAESFASATGSAPKGKFAEKTAYYKDLLKKYIDESVNKAKAPSKEKKGFKKKKKKKND